MASVSFLSSTVPRCCFRHSYSLHIDKPEFFVDAPVGLQVIARTHEEEAAIAMTEVIDAALKTYKCKRVRYE